MISYFAVPGVQIVMGAHYAGVETRRKHLTINESHTELPELPENLKPILDQL